ncbi:MAG: CaiB/BaiF CoA transferase family protein [Bacteroidota bacterium]|jgi:crotonobetainyl-CoA:carnitine CoA-transferase CaiB-like acyl-CoA transferase
MHLPLQDIRVLEFTHAVMGPSAGLILADLGAEVIHIEPVEGDSTRSLKGFGQGFFSCYNRNKKSLAIDIKSAEGKAIIYQLVEKADVLIENFGPGTMDRLTYGYKQLKAINPRLIYCSLKGFMPGPYEKRHAMDEVVQMMGGLAYMTGRPGDPLRAGTSIVDITGGMFGCMGILLALYERERTGKGKLVKAGLFETTAFVMGQHMALSAMTRQPVPPMPARLSPWSIYRIFETADQQQVFIGIISEKHWKRFCDVFDRSDWLSDERLQTNNQRVDAKEWFQPEVEKMIAQFTLAEVLKRCEQAEITFAPISRTEDLFTDEHLNKSGALLDVQLTDGTPTRLPKTPIAYEGAEISLRIHPPRVGEHTQSILAALGMNDQAITELKNKNIIAL